MLERIRTFGRMVAFSHSIFALPFALAAATLASRQVTVGWSQLVWIVLCMLTARSAAMGFNRILDRDIDASNPRTQDRDLPAGRISVGAAWAFTIGAALLFVASSAMLGRLTLILSPVALAVVLGYSWTKRFTALCHLVLGLALALAPTAVWIALTGGWGVVPALLSFTVLTWVAGFDIIYACQDADFDRRAGLYSIPSRLGVGPALALSAALHVATVAALAALPWVVPLGPIYGVGVVGIAGVLAYEHTIVSPTDLSRVNKAFFDLNGYVSLMFLGVVWLG
jgi:4-hydroxybenzoate polyprenyltransferase